MAVTCAGTILNLGASGCKKTIKILKGIIKTSDSYTITALLAASATQWQTDIKADINARIYLFPQWAKSFEDISSEQALEETPLAVMDTSPGQHRWNLGFVENIELHKAMYSHRNTEGRVFIIDIDNQIWGTSEDEGVTLKGFLLDNLLPQKLKVSDGTVSTKTIVGVYLADNTELDKRTFGVDAPFANSLIPLTSAVITIAASPVPSSTAFNFSVASKLDGTPVIGLVKADLLFLDAAGANQDSTIDTVTEPLADGDYVIAGTAMATGSLSLVLPSALTLDAWESTGAQTVTVV